VKPNFVSLKKGPDMKKKLLLIPVVAALGIAGPASAAAFKGVVVSKQHGTLLVAGANGTVHAIKGTARVGARVSVDGARLRTVGRAHRAVVRGVVVRRSAGVTFLSAAGHMLAVHVARRLASASVTTPVTPTTPTTPTTPAPGAVVQTTVAIGDQGDLEDEGERQVGQTGSAQVTATVTAVGAGTVTLSVNGQALTIPLPTGLTLPATLVGTQVTLNLSFAGGQATGQQDGQNGSQDEGDQNDDHQDSGDGGDDD
jgi:hypothetical protein